MSEQTEEKMSITVGGMLRTTGENTARFMFQIAEHIEGLENEIQKLSARITELESK
jgi:hypothetical protein